MERIRPTDTGLIWKKAKAFNSTVECHALNAFRKGETYITTRYTYYKESTPYADFVWRVHRIQHHGKTLPPPELVAQYTPGSI